MDENNDDGQKRKPKFNALVHGVYSRDILLPWEKREDFETLVRGLNDELHPSGRAEEETVLDVAFAMWKKRDLERLWVLQICKSPFTQEIVKSGKKSWTGIRKHARKEARSAGTLRRTMDDACASLV